MGAQMVTERRRREDTTQAKALKWLGIPGAIVAAGAGVWTMLGWADAKPALERDVRPMWAAIESVSKATTLNSWQLLEARRNAQGLGPTELREYCALGNLLSIQGDGCR